MTSSPLVDAKVHLITNHSHAQKSDTALHPRATTCKRTLAYNLSAPQRSDVKCSCGERETEREREREEERERERERGRETEREDTERERERERYERKKERKRKHNNTRSVAVVHTKTTGM